MSKSPFHNPSLGVATLLSLLFIVSIVAITSPKAIKLDIMTPIGGVSLNTSERNIEESNVRCRSQRALVS